MILHLSFKQRKDETKWVRQTTRLVLALFVPVFMMYQPAQTSTLLSFNDNGKLALMIW